MMTLDQLSKASINPKVAQAAHEDVEKRLTDLLNIKNAFETKATTLSSVYVTVALALFGGGSALRETDGMSGLAAGLWLTGAAFVIGAAFFVMAFRQQTYGTLGGDPDLWLRPGVIDGNDKALAVNLAYITSFHKARIDISESSNRVKGQWIERGIWTGTLAPLILFVSLWLK